MVVAKRVLITGAAGQIAYSLIPMVCTGQMLGPDQPVELVLLDIPAAEKTLKGVMMEIQDMAFELLVSCKATVNTAEAFQGVDIACLIGARPRGPGMERKDLLQANANIFKIQGEALEKYASREVKVVVVGNPANTNAAIAAACAPSIPSRNFTALTRLDQNRAKAMLAHKAGASVGDVDNAIIWGNHSATQYPDWHHAKVDQIQAKIADLIMDEQWFTMDFIPAVQKRGAAIIKARKLSSAMSAAKAISDHVHDWVVGTPINKYVSMAVASDGSYGVPKGLVFSFPVVCFNQDWSIVQGLDINAQSQTLMDVTQAELQEERSTAFSHLFGSPSPRL